MKNISRRQKGIFRTCRKKSLSLTRFMAVSGSGISQKCEAQIRQRPGGRGNNLCYTGMRKRFGG